MLRLVADQLISIVRSIQLNVAARRLTGLLKVMECLLGNSGQCFFIACVMHCLQYLELLDTQSATAIFRASFFQQQLVGIVSAAITGNSRTLIQAWVELTLDVAIVASALVDVDSILHTGWQTFQTVVMVGLDDEVVSLAKVRFAVRLAGVLQELRHGVLQRVSIAAVDCKIPFFGSTSAFFVFMVIVMIISKDDRASNSNEEQCCNGTEADHVVCLFARFEASDL